MVSEDLLVELKEIMKQDHKLDLSKKEVSDSGNGLCNYFVHLAKLACENYYENENKGNRID